MSTKVPLEMQTLRNSRITSGKSVNVVASATIVVHSRLASSLGELHLE